MRASRFRCGTPLGAGDGLDSVGGLPPRMLRAYRQTLYDVDGAPFRLGHRSLAVDQLLSNNRAREAAFITAYNPRSRRKPSGWNRRMQMNLVQALRRYNVVSGHGRWRRWCESHLLVLGAVQPARKLARCFRQNAIVMVRQRQPARLLITFRRVGSPETGGDNGKICAMGGSPRTAGSV